MMVIRDRTDEVSNQEDIEVTWYMFYGYCIVLLIDNKDNVFRT